MLDDFISLFFPKYCMSCNKGLVKGEEILCLECEFSLPKTLSHQNTDNYILQKFYGKIQLTEANAFYLFSKAGGVQQILHRLKYKDRPKLGVYLGSKYANWLTEEKYIPNYDLIVPVPLHQIKFKKRGYNQSAEFAKGISEVWNVPVITEALTRIKNTETQTNRSRLARWQNVNEMFHVSHQELIQGKKILLVDDVITTGSTLESCAQVLIESGAESVGVIAIAAAK